MLVWVQGSVCHITAGSHPVQEAWGSQDSLYFNVVKTIPTDSARYNDSEKSIV